MSIIRAVQVSRSSTTICFHSIPTDSSVQNPPGGEVHCIKWRRHTSAISPGKCKVYNSAKQETIRHTPKKSTPEPIKNKEPTLATEPAIKPIKRNLIAEYQEQNSKITELTPSDIPLNTDVTSNVLVKRTTAGSLTSSLLQLKGHWVDWLQDKSSLQSQVETSEAQLMEKYDAYFVKPEEMDAMQQQQGGG